MDNESETITQFLPDPNSAIVEAIKGLNKERQMLNDSIAHRTAPIAFRSEGSLEHKILRSKQKRVEAIDAQIENYVRIATQATEKH